MSAYRQLEERFRRIGAIEQAISVLHWDTAAIGAILARGRCDRPEKCPGDAVAFLHRHGARLIGLHMNGALP